MKFFKRIILFIMAMFVFSCVTTEDQTTDDMSENLDSDVVETVMEVEDNKEVVLYYPVVKNDFYGDGQIDTKTTFEYNKNFLLIKKSVTNEQDEALETTVNKYSGSNLISTYTYGMNNELLSYTKFSYDENGNLVESNLFNKDDKVQSTNSYVVEDNMVKEWRTFGPNGGVLAITSYTYNKNGQLVKIEMKDAGGVVDGTIEKKYKKSKLVEEEVLNSKGKSEKLTKYTYKNNVLVSIQYLNSKGKITRSESFEYKDGMKAPFKSNYLFRSGAVESYSEFEYITEVKTK